MFLRRPKFNRRTLPFLALLCSALVITLIYELELYRSFHPRPEIPQSPFAHGLQTGLEPNRPGKPKDWARPGLINPQKGEDVSSNNKIEPHPIDDLVRAGAEEFELLKTKQTKGVRDAAEAYRKKRGRHPPPRFDQWVQFAEANNAVIIEDFFDRIHHDLDPFWALPPDQIRNAISSWFHMISIRDGEVTQRTEGDRQWMNVWREMLSQISQLLPDVDIPVNELDEPRVLVPWESINHLKTISDMRRETLHPSHDFAITQKYSKLRPAVHNPEKFRHEFYKDAPIWSFIKESCPPDSPARHSSLKQDFDSLPAFNFTIDLNHTHHGFVSNWTYNTDPCQQPHLSGLHGAFVEPISMSSTRKLIPLFGGSKFSMNNDILLPAARYWIDDDAAVDGSNAHDWQQKKDGIMWRGAASGGRHRATTWRHFQRQRLVSMVNSSQIQAEQSRLNWITQATKEREDSGMNPDAPHNFPMPDTHIFRISAAKDNRLPEWVDEFSDAGFTFMNCFPIEEAHGTAGCSYTDNFFEVVPFVPLQEQIRSKYLPDVDGSAFSDRFRSFLRSTSLPIKATVYSEWHDSRLVAWKHFIPMDNTFYDLYGIMDYLLGYNGGPGGTYYKGHDAVARDIAMSGRDWAQKVLRKEDMIIYMYRLILEYARICEDNRAHMGYVDDITSSSDSDFSADATNAASLAPLFLDDAGRFSDTTKYQKNKASGADWEEESQEDLKHQDSIDATPLENLPPDGSVPDHKKPAFQNDRFEEAADSLSKQFLHTGDDSTSDGVRQDKKGTKGATGSSESHPGSGITREGGHASFEEPETAEAAVARGLDAGVEETTESIVADKRRILRRRRDILKQEDA